MKRALVDLALRLPLRWLDESIPVSRIQTFLSKHADVVKVNPALAEMEEKKALEWRKSLPAGKPFIKETFTPGLAVGLDWMDSHGSKEQRAFAAQWLERLLRHVEVRRKSCLPAFTFLISKEQFWLERHAVTILFCRVARRHHDLRFLNAAFKLNDWAFTIHQGNISPALFSAYLLALDEQESAARELMK